MIRQPGDIRPNIIPYGNCLPGNPSAEAFTRIENGDTSNALVEAARAACLTCPQLKHCDVQRTEIATEFWRQGTGVPFLVDQLTESPSATLQERPLQPATLAFDMSQVPGDPKRQLTVVRQAVRADQLTLVGVNSPGVKDVTEEYLALLPRAEQQRMAHHIGGKQILTEAVRRIVRLKFQQLDFGSRQPSDRTRSYYDPATFDVAAHQTVISLFLENVIDLKELKLRYPDKKAALFDPEFYRQLRTRYINAELTPSLFDNVLSANPRNPVGALDTYKVNLHRLRAEAAELGIHVRETTLRKAARLGHDLDKVRDRKMSEDVELPDYVTSGVVKTLTGRHPDNPTSAVFRFVDGVESVRDTYEKRGVPLSDITEIVLTNPTTYAKALERYSDNCSKLAEAYGTNTDITEGYRRRLARAYPNPMPEAQAYISRLAKLRQECGGAFSDPILKSGAQRGIESMAELNRDVFIRRTRDKFNRRLKRKPHLVSPDRWIIDKVTTLYPEWEWDGAAEGVFELLNENLITADVVDFSLLPTHLQPFKKVCHDKSQRHVTFAANAASLSRLNRLAVAQVFHLAPLIYGQELSPVALEAALEVEDLSSHVAKVVRARSGKHPNATAKNLTVSGLYADLEAYGAIASDRQPTERVEAIKQTSTAMIGAKLVSMTDQLHGAPSNLPAWVEKTICDLYPPNQQGMARVHTKRALRAGILSIVNTSSTEQRLAFGPALTAPDLSDKERAIATYAYGVDRILFHKDIGGMLGNQLTPLSMAIAVRRAVSPSVRVQIEPAPFMKPKAGAVGVAVSKTTQKPSKPAAKTTQEDAWRDEALCLQSDALIFDPPEHLEPEEVLRYNAMAKKTCTECAVKDACLTEAIATDNRYGVWGGMTYDERVGEARRRRRLAKAAAARAISYQADIDTTVKDINP